jgi:N-acetylglucosaminyldiphosphoundecaprenol N-acetyl-beta-D-mannosaminyltransferase
MTERINILGVGVSAVNTSMALDTVDEWIARDDRHYVCVTGVHGIMESHRQEAVRNIHNGAGLVVPDGMPLVWLSRLKGFHNVNRVYGPDLMLALCERSIGRGYRHFLYGGAGGIARRLAVRLQLRFPGLKVVGVYSPPFRPLEPAEDEQIVEVINSARPHIVWVGISTPKQEAWMAEHVGRLHVPVLIGVGAAFDFHAGVKRQAPRWVMRTGLEWMFRMIQEPRRLGPRYLINNPAFIGLVIRQLLGRQPAELSSLALPRRGGHAGLGAERAKASS